MTSTEKQEFTNTATRDFCRNRIAPREENLALSSWLKELVINFISSVLLRNLNNYLCKIVESVRDLHLNSQGTDKSGNKQFSDIGVAIKDGLAKYCKEKGMNITLKYIDPSYMVRSIRANAYDSGYCA